MGFALGGMVGAAIGVLFGGYSGWRVGLRGAELLRVTGKSALQSGGAFGGFMAIGSVIRCDEKATRTRPVRERTRQTAREKRNVLL